MCDKHGPDEATVTYLVDFSTEEGTLPVSSEMEVDVPLTVGHEDLEDYLLQSVCELEELEPAFTRLLGWAKLDEGGDVALAALGEDGGTDSYTADAMAERGEDDISDIEDGGTMETIDIAIRFLTPPADKAAEVFRRFQAVAGQHHAAKTFDYVDGPYTVHTACFEFTEDAAAFAAWFNKHAGLAPEIQTKKVN